MSASRAPGNARDRAPFRDGSGTQLSIRLLGDFSLSMGDLPEKAINTHRLQSLVAYMLLHRDAPQARQHIAFLFWPDSSEMQAQANLRNLILVLKRAFPNVERYIAVTRRDLRWRNDRPCSLDVAEFERAVEGAQPVLTDTHRSNGHRGKDGEIRHARVALQQAVDLYRGDLLPGCYDEWIVAPRERLREQYQWSLEQLANFCEREGNMAAAIMYAQRLAMQNPLLEENYRRLMELHLANGDRAGALNVYKQCVRTLKHELGVEPGPAIAELMEQARERPLRGKPTSGARAGAQPSGDEQLNIASLPAQTTLFIGRERELADLSSLIRRENVRLVTLTGTAGTGKTRLAIALAASLTLNTPDGIYFVSLASTDDPGHVTSALASALGLIEAQGNDLLRSLAARISSRHMLLLVDNFEHLLPAAGVIGELLALCPQLKVLVTSRSVLNLRGEHEYPVSPLPVPPRDVPPRPDELLAYESISLFADRAQQAAPEFAITSSNARSVVEICRKLDGLPLAIELAAARVKVLSPEAILSRLDRRLKLLVGGPVDLPQRQRGLETAIEWSYNLLDEDEKRLFRTLSVFEGGFTADAASSVVDATDTGFDVLVALTSLLDKSLVLRELLIPSLKGALNDELQVTNDESRTQQSVMRNSGLPATPGTGLPLGTELVISSGRDDVRFGMLATLKEYAWGQLVDSAESEATRRRHAGYFLKMAQSLAVELKGPGVQEALARLDVEHDNVRSALRWAIEQNEADIALQMTAALGSFWEVRGYLNEGTQWLQEALSLRPGASGTSGASGTPSRYRGPALYYCGILAVRQRHYAEAEALLRESLALYRQAVDKEGMSNALSALAVMTLDKDYEQAVALHMESLQLRRELGDEVQVAKTLQNLGFIKMHQGKWDEASELTRESLAIYRKRGIASGIPYTLYVLAMVTAGQGDYARARERFEECLIACAKNKYDWLTAWALHGLAEVLYHGGEYQAASSRLAEAQAKFIELGDRLGMAHAKVSRAREAHRTGLYEDAESLFIEALELGRALDNHGVIACCLAGFAALAGSRGDLRRSAFLFGCAQDLFHSQSTTLERSVMTMNMEEVRQALEREEPGAWETARREGEATPWAKALETASRG